MALSKQHPTLATTPVTKAHTTSPCISAHMSMKTHPITLRIVAEHVSFWQTDIVALHHWTIDVSYLCQSQLPVYSKPRQMSLCFIAPPTHTLYCCFLVLTSSYYTPVHKKIYKYLIQKKSMLRKTVIILYMPEEMSITSNTEHVDTYQRQ